MNNLDKTIKKILKNIHYNLGNTVNEQSSGWYNMEIDKNSNYVDVTGGVTAGSGVDVDYQTTAGNNWGVGPRKWTVKKPESKVAIKSGKNIDISPTLYRFETVISGMEFTIPKGGKYSIKPIRWHNRFEKYDKKRAERLFGKWCKSVSTGNLHHGVVTNKRASQFFWDHEKNQACGWIKDEAWSAIYEGLVAQNHFGYWDIDPGGHYKKMLKVYKDSGAMDDWENTVKNEGDGKTYYSSPYISLTLKKGVDYGNGIKIKNDGQYGIYQNKYTIPKGCKPLTVDECLRFSFDSLNQRTKAGMTVFEVIDRSNYDGKDSGTIKRTKWAACLYNQQSSNFDSLNLSDNEFNYYMSGTRYPWETKFAGYGKVGESNPKCIDKTHEIIPTDVSFKLPGSEYGSMDYNQKKQLEKETEVKYDYPYKYDWHGKLFQAKLYGLKPTISAEKIKEYNNKKAILSNGGIVAGR